MLSLDFYSSLFLKQKKVMEMISGLVVLLFEVLFSKSTFTRGCLSRKWFK